MNVLLPENGQKKFKTLWLLHGLSDDHSAWMRYTAVERYALNYGLAVVMPGVGRSWYTDTANGEKYFTFITRELPDKMACFFKGYSSAREDNLIMGLSMGGYGALKAACTYPKQYGFCEAFSGALDITRENRAYDLDQWRGIFGYDLQSAAQLEGTDHDLFALTQKNGDFPFIYMWCGTEDSLLEVNRRFSAHLSALEIPHIFQSSQGDHSWKWWDMHLQKALEYWSENI